MIYNFFHRDAAMETGIYEERNDTIYGRPMAYVYNKGHWYRGVSAEVMDSTTFIDKIKLPKLFYRLGGNKLIKICSNDIFVDDDIERTRADTTLTESQKFFG